ncbi:unnamed protein product [Phytomonas sp. Hart1]|nr:unnamed protein product [Phytomonas sp. Hart1]|eukprot:CCW70070.1 unnamed protein product [Phytomonas sp. isolate Hart1]
MDVSSLASLSSCISYNYNSNTKRAFAVPRLAHQFKLEWSWPAASCVVSRLSTDKTNAPASLKCGPVSSVLEEENGKSKGDESPNKCLTYADPIPTSLLFTNGEIATEMLTDRFQGETTILTMSGDPHPTPHCEYDTFGMTSETFHLQRVALILSAGYRFCIPLQALKTSEYHADTSSTTYWKVVLKSPKDSPDAVVPFCSEVVVGELAAIEWVSKQRQEEHSQPLTKPANYLTSKSKRDAVKAHWAPLHICPSDLPVQSFFFHSIPYKLMWLSYVPNRLLVSLPCEERLVTLDVPPKVVDGYVSGQTEPIARRPSHAFQLPRGVVPLDMAEIYARPFIAVGTYEHGVLIYYLNLSTGEVVYAVRQISICGTGSTIFPITKLAAVFPPPRSHLDNHQTARNTITTAFKWKKQAEDIASLSDGVLLCSSAFDPQPFIAKQLNLKDAIIENFAVGRLTEEIIWVGSQIDPHVGVLFSTVSQGFVRLVVYPEGGRRFGKLVGRDSSDSSCHESSSDEASDSAHEQDVQQTPHAHDYDHVLALLTRLRANSSCSCSERVPPFVCALRNKGSALGGILRVAEGITVCKAEGRYAHKDNPIYGPSTRHWMPAVTLDNKLLLLDRITTRYNVVSALPLALPSHAEKSQKLHQTRKGSNSDDVNPKDSTKKKKNTPSMSTARPKRQRGDLNKSKETTVPCEMEDLCTGVVSLSAGHAWLCVAASHHQNWISIVSYLGVKNSTK